MQLLEKNQNNANKYVLGTKRGLSYKHFFVLNGSIHTKTKMSKNEPKRVIFDPVSIF